MFDVLYDGLLIGTTTLARGGDVPMGCAEGDFEPGCAFNTFLDSVTPCCLHEEGIQLWSGLSVRMQDGTCVDCADVVLQRVIFSASEVEMTVDVLGVTSPPYADLFPQHVHAYEKQFREL